MKLANNTGIRAFCKEGEDKEMLLKDKSVLTDSGNCYHIKISMAAFPKRRETATTLLTGLLSQGREQE